MGNDGLIYRLHQISFFFLGTCLGLKVFKSFEEDI
jgi:hypothetical protein